MNRTHRTAARQPAAHLLGMLTLAALAAAGPAAASSDAKSAIDPVKAGKEATQLVLATIDGEPITLNDLQDGFGARHMGHGSLLAGKSILRQVLDSSIEERLIIQEGLRMGIPDEPAIIEAVAAFRDVQYLKAMEEQEFHHAAAPTQAEIDEAYARLKIQRRLFLIETPSRERADEAMRRIEGGEEFGEVARDISLHHSRSRGGDLGWVTWGRLSPAADEVVTKARAGETVGPVAGEGAWEIVRVIEIKESEPPEIGRVADRLREILRQRKRTTLFRDFVSTIREKHPPVENGEALEALSREGAAADDDKEGGEEERLPGATVLMKTETGLELTVGKIRERAERAGMPLAEAWKKAAVDTLLIDEARRRIKPDEAMEGRIHAYRDGLVRQKVQMLALAAMPDISEKEVRAYYEKQSAGFKAPDAYHLRHILVATKAEADRIRASLAEGADFAALAKEHSIDPESAGAGGELGWVDAPADGAAAGEATGILALAPGEISGVIPMKEGFAIVQMLERREGRMPAYEEVKLEAARVLVGKKQKEVMNRFLEQLRDHAEITMNEKALERGVLLLDAIAAARLTPAAAGGKPGSHP